MFRRSNRNGLQIIHKHVTSRRQISVIPTTKRNIHRLKATNLNHTNRKNLARSTNHPNRPLRTITSKTRRTLTTQGHNRHQNMLPSNLTNNNIRNTIHGVRNKPLPTINRHNHMNHRLRQYRNNITLPSNNRRDRPNLMIFITTPHRTTLYLNSFGTNKHNRSRLTYRHKGRVRTRPPPSVMGRSITTMFRHHTRICQPTITMLRTTQLMTTMGPMPPNTISHNNKISTHNRHHHNRNKLRNQPQHMRPLTSTIRRQHNDVNKRHHMIYTMTIRVRTQRTSNNRSTTNLRVRSRYHPNATLPPNLNDLNNTRGLSLKWGHILRFFLRDTIRNRRRHNPKHDLPRKRNTTRDTIGTNIRRRPPILPTRRIIVNNLRPTLPSSDVRHGTTPPNDKPLLYHSQPNRTRHVKRRHTIQPNTRTANNDPRYTTLRGVNLMGQHRGIATSTLRRKRLPHQHNDGGNDGLYFRVLTTYRTLCNFCNLTRINTQQYQRTRMSIVRNNITNRGSPNTIRSNPTHNILNRNMTNKTNLNNLINMMINTSRLRPNRPHRRHHGRHTTRRRRRHRTSTTTIKIFTINRKVASMGGKFIY